MSTINANQQLTLIELANRKDPDGNTARIAEILNEDNDIMGDMPWTEANNTNAYQITQRFSLPTGSWRDLNEGVAVEASKTRKVNEVIGNLEAFSQTDTMIIDMAPNPSEARMNEASSFIEGMGQNFAGTVVYGNASINTDRFTGLAPRLASLNTGNRANVLAVGTAGSGSANTSIFIVQWGENTVHMSYPKGHPNFGIEHEDLGRLSVDVGTTAGTHELMMAYRDHFVIRGGLVVHDERCIARAVNIVSSSTTIDDTLIKLLNGMKNKGKNAILYANRTVFNWMTIDAKDKSNVNYFVDNPFGEQVITFMGHPIRLVDQITQTEGTIA